MPKLRAEQLGAALTKQLASIYLVSGDEPLLIQECCDQIRAAARKNGFSERELYHVDTSFDWGQLLAAANSLSLFAEKKIIEVRMPTGKPGDKGGKILQEYAQSPAPDNLLLIVTEKLDGATQKSKWFKAIEDAGQHIQVWPVTPAQLPRWIGVRLQQSGLHADSDAIDLLASRIEGNLLAAAQEIEKLKLLATDNRISYELMASVVADSARYDVFGLTDKALHGDARAAVQAGVTRFSIGVQSMNTAVLRDLGRRHGPGDVVEGVAAARAAATTTWWTACRSPTWQPWPTSVPT